ncbi:MAG: ATP-dependent DNA helicase RecG, partial [Clostridiales bacterium]|nr:ATP-dependent DNA helicase RecG [Clostridiales bacterium]
DTTTLTPIDEIIIGETVTVRGKLKGKGVLRRFSGRSSVTQILEDEQGAQLSCVWFNQPWMAKQISSSQVLLYGTVSRFKNGLQLVNPVVIKEQGILPVYKPIEGIGSNTLAGFIKEILNKKEETFEPFLNETLLFQYQLMEKNQAIREAHAPTEKMHLEKAIYTLQFEKLLLYQMAMETVKNKEDKSHPLLVPKKETSFFWGQVPFTPTEAQKNVLTKIKEDMEKTKPMNRLIQGDVGSGKTVVAFGALYFAVKAGFQGAMMAPTEILARQHFENAKKLFDPLQISCGLLIGSMKEKEKREARESIEAGQWQIIIGTHALIAQKVTYENLGLVITDEQHRFGVGQRTTLIQKGEEKHQQLLPHLLVMSATPIPRTLALILYGDLDISVIDELPAGRKAISTRIVPEEKRRQMYGFIEKEVKKGNQAYIICPLIEESEHLENVKDVVTHYKYLKEGPFKNCRLGLAHGNQKNEEKAETLEAFSRGDTQILVATTVVEVGVDVPNATIMVIEDAHRYGLSQLHQLRGRVGRGKKESWCFLLAEANQRLKTLVNSTDGFEIAQKDLELRG